MTFDKIKIFGLYLMMLALSSCGDRSNSILNNRNFDEGNWLLVVDNKAEKTLYIINDRQVLKSHPFGILLGRLADCSWTTCDVFINLYKDGELVASQQFLSKSNLYEKKSLVENYKKASLECISPVDKDHFKHLWDSLVNVPKIYPTRYHTQPEDKEIICYYNYE